MRRSKAFIAFLSLVACHPTPLPPESVPDSELTFKVDYGAFQEDRPLSERHGVFSVYFGNRNAQVIGELPGGIGLGPVMAQPNDGRGRFGGLLSAQPVQGYGVMRYRNGMPEIQRDPITPFPRSSVYVSEHGDGLAWIHEFSCAEGAITEDPVCVDIAIWNGDRENPSRNVHERNVLPPESHPRWGRSHSHQYIRGWGTIFLVAVPSTALSRILVDPAVEDLKLYARGLGADVPVDVARRTQPPSPDEAGQPFDVALLWPDDSITHYGAEADANGMIETVWEARASSAEEAASPSFVSHADCHPDDMQRFGRRFIPERWSVEFDWYPDTGHVAEIRHFTDGLQEGVYFAFEPGGEVIVQGCFKGGLRHGVFYRFGYTGRPLRRTLVEIELFTLGRSVAVWKAPSDVDILWGRCSPDTLVFKSAEDDEKSQGPGFQRPDSLPWWYDRPFAWAGFVRTDASDFGSRDPAWLCRIRLAAPKVE